MPIFDRGDIVAVPFPYVERPVVENRPALIVSGHLGPRGALLWVLMITSGRHERWPGDVEIATGQSDTGLRIASVVRTAKIATIEASAARVIGRMSEADLRSVDAALAAAFGRA